MVTPFVRLHPDDHGVGAELLGVGVRERQVRCAFEHHGDLGDPAAEPLAGAQVERHPGPAAGVDQNLDGGVGLGGGRRRDAVLLEVPMTFCAALPAARRTGRGRWPWPGRRAAAPRTAPWSSRSEGPWVEGDRLLHGGQRQQLQQVVLDDVAGGADAVVVAGPAADADVLGHGDLHVVDVVGVPDRARTAGWRSAAPAGSAPSPCRGSGRSGTRVPGKTELTTSLSCCADVRSWPNGFSMTTRRHSSPCGSHSPDRLSCLQHHRERARRDREVEGVVAAGAPGPVQVAQRLRQGVERDRRRRRCPGRTGSPRPDAARPARRTGSGRTP